ncbi:Anthranilate phosphoribosyltransferase family protein [Giardia duodenalis]|uniref:Anthranilate phosphoribosyltransferase family protein n=1 Tax=Giardia intestinalis TaxID=5741 RepID=V6TJM0_GIAIN|nr:Anthranilate phosphoribosyltransferase family protein [Giardia intestinalis]
MEARNREALINDLAQSIAISNGIAFLVGARLIEYHDFSHIISEQSVRTGQLPDKIGQMLHNLMIFSISYDNLMQCLRPSMTSSFFQEGLRIVADFVARILRFQPLTTLLAIYKAIIGLYCDLLGQYDPNLYFNGDIFTEDWAIQDRILTTTITTFVERRFGFSVPRQYPAARGALDVPDYLSLSTQCKTHLGQQTSGPTEWHQSTQDLTPNYTPADPVYSAHISRPGSHSHSRSRTSPGVRFASGTSGDTSSSKLSVSHLVSTKPALRPGTGSISAQRCPSRSKSPAIYTPQSLHFQYSSNQPSVSAHQGLKDEQEQESQDSTLDTAQSWLDKCTAELVLERNRTQQQILYDQFILMIEGTLKRLKSFKVDARSRSPEDIDDLLSQITEKTIRQGKAFMPDAILREENARLKSQLQELEATTAEISRKYKEKEMTCEELSSQYSSMKELNEALHREKRDNLEQTRSLQEKHTTTEEDLARQKRLIKDLESRLEAYKDQLVSYEAQLSEMNIKLGSSKHETALQAELKEALERTLKNYEAENKLLTETLTSKQEEISLLQNKLTTQNASIIKSSGLITSLQTDLAVNETTSQGREKELMQVQARYEGLLQEHTSLKSLFETEKKNYSKTIDSLSLTQKRLTEADEKCKELAETSSILKNRLGEIEAKASTDESLAKRLTLENTQLRGELQLAQTTLLEIKTSMRSASNKHSASQSPTHSVSPQLGVLSSEPSRESMELIKQNNELSAKLLQLQTERQQHVAEKADLEARLKETQDSLAHSSAETAALQKQLRQIMTAQQAMLAKREEDVETGVACKEELGRENAQLKVKILNLERLLANSASETADLTAQLTEKRTQIDTLNVTLSDLKKEIFELTNTRTDLLQQLEVANASLKRLQEETEYLRENQQRQSQQSADELTAAREKIKEARNLEHKLGSLEVDLRSENTLLQDQLKDLSSAHMDALSMIEKLNEENRNLRQDLNLLTETAHNGTRQIEKLLYKNEQLRQSMNTQSILSSASAVDSSTAQKGGATTQENERLRTELANLQEMQHADKNTIQALNEEIARISQESSAVRELATTLESSLQEARAENDDLRRQISRTDDSMHRLFTESKTLASRVQQQQATIVDLEDQLTKARARTPPNIGRQSDTGSSK